MCVCARVHDLSTNRLKQRKGGKRPPWEKGDENIATLLTSQSNHTISQQTAPSSHQLLGSPPPPAPPGPPSYVDYPVWPSRALLYNMSPGTPPPPPHTPPSPRGPGRGTAPHQDPTPISPARWGQVCRTGRTSSCPHSSPVRPSNSEPCFRDPGSTASSEPAWAPHDSFSIPLPQAGAAGTCCLPFPRPGTQVKGGALPTRGRRPEQTRGAHHYCWSSA